MTLVSLLLLALASLSILRVHFETDIFKLFPSQQGALRLFLDTLNWSGGANEAQEKMEKHLSLSPKLALISLPAFMALWSNRDQCKSG